MTVQMRSESGNAGRNPGLLDWLDHRTGFRDFVSDALYERVPGGARWRYVWGSTLVFAFIVQLITGFFLWTSYSPNSQGAWESVYYIQHEMQGGWLLRGVHHFMAQAMVVLLALHLMQVVIDGAYKAPREVNFWLGLILMQIVLGLSLTGYLLPWDQKGFWATKVATNIMGMTPVIGSELQKLVIGGTEYGHLTLTRFFALHAGFLPGLLIAFLVLHIYVFRRHGLTAYKPDVQQDTTFWPDQVLRDAVACLAVLAVVLFLVFWPWLRGAGSGGDGPAIGPELGAHLGAPADRGEQFSAARPEWYFLFLFQLLKKFHGENEVYGAIVIPGATLLLMALMPFIGRWKFGHRFNVGCLCCLMIGIVALTVQAKSDDAENADYQAAVREADQAAERTVELVRAKGIGPAGAVELVRNDPLLQGPKLFAKKCASCHRYHGHDGTGRTMLAGGTPSPSPAGGGATRHPNRSASDGAIKPTAADLGRFGSREWVRSVLTDYKTVFAPIGNTANEEIASAFLELGQMADWSETNKELLLKEDNRRSLQALVEFVVSQSRRDDLQPFDPKLVEAGRKLFETGKLANGSLSSACADCHTLRPVGEAELFGLEGLAPTLTGYGGEEWLREFISDPGSENYYGSTTNGMPAFGDQLSDAELTLLVRWLTNDYYMPGSRQDGGD